jgi:HEAT repeat protein
MSQIKKIYHFITQTKNPAADQALLMGLRRAEEPYRTVILKSIVAGRRTHGTAELVRNFHTYPEHWQEILGHKADKLHQGLQQVANESTTQTRLNALTIIKRSRYGRLADLVATLLRDQYSEVSQAAGEALRELGITCSGEMFSQSENIFLNTALNSTRPEQRDQRSLLSAIDAAVRNYKLHRRPEPIYAAMCLVPATATCFWKNQLEPYHVVGKIVRNILTAHVAPELIPFTLSALADSELRFAAILSLTHQVRPDYVSALALYIAGVQDKAIRLNLSLLKQPRWLDPSTTPPAKIELKSQPALVRLVMAVGAEPEIKGQYLAAICEQGTKAAGLIALKALATLPPELTPAAYRRAAGSDHEEVAILALKKLLAMKTPQPRRFLAQKLKSTHPSVRDLARSALKATLLNSYWRNFGTLSNEHKRIAGETLHKIDPELAQQHWLKQAGMNNPNQRFQAVRMAMILDQIEAPYLKTILTLTNDTHAKVRSSAIAALGQIQPQAITQVQPYLIRALKDNDMRVRANVIETLEKLDLRETTPSIQPFMKSLDHRLRANTIKALLSWETDVAKSELENMVTDSNSKHRRSGLWVLKQTQSLPNLPKLIQQKLTESTYATPTVLAQ